MFHVEQFDSRAHWAEWEEGSALRETVGPILRELTPLSKKYGQTVLQDLKTEFFSDTFEGWEEA